MRRFALVISARVKLFNNAAMPSPVSFRIFVIADINQQNIAAIIFQRTNILSVFDLNIISDSGKSTVTRI